MSSENITQCFISSIAVRICIQFISHKHAAQQTENSNAHTIDNGER